MTGVREERRAAGRVWLGAVIALVSGTPILAWGLLTTGQLRLDWFVPLCDAAAIVCMLVTLSLAWLDVELRGDRRSLPIAVIAVATIVMWAGHMVLFPGVAPGLSGTLPSVAAANLFLLINLATPLLLVAALLQSGGPPTRPRAHLLWASAIGIGIGIGGVLAALLLSLFFESITPGGTFAPGTGLVGVAGLIPVLAGLIALAAGRRGDERVTAGVLAALTYSGINSISILFVDARYTTTWYADQLLALLPFPALLAGQLRLYAESVRSELAASSQAARAATRLRTGLEVAEAMATQVQLESRIERLLTGAMEAVSADRASLLRVGMDERMVVEAAMDLHAPAAPVGRSFRIDDLQAQGEPLVQRAIAERKAVTAGQYTVDGLDGTLAAAIAGVRHTLVLPLTLSSDVDTVLILGRRADPPFSQADIELLQELAPIAAIQIRNARLLQAAEAASIAKSSFLNLAAHELRTPITVINGYLDMLAEGSLGTSTDNQGQIVETLRAKARELSDHVERMLLASRLGAETPDFSANGRSLAFDLGRAVTAAVERARPRAELMGTSIEVKVPKAKVIAGGDASEVGVIVDNLLNNAITYGGASGQIRVEMAARPAPLVRVQDKGIGIPPDQYDLVFEQFHRVDNPKFGYPAGTGLGLYISRRLAEMQGGNLELEWSDPDTGSSFIMRLLPGSERAHSQRPASRSTTGAKASIEPRTAI